MWALTVLPTGDEIATVVGQLVDLQSLTFYESDPTDQGLRQLKSAR